MTPFEQFEAWIELRIVARRATRGEVYALRRYRRADTPCTRAALLSAYADAVFVQPFMPVMKRMIEATEEAARKINDLVMRWNAAVVEHVDLGEFDNRAHDWMRS